MAHITVNKLFVGHVDEFGLGWITGQAGSARKITPEGALIGHLDLIHPNRIQVLGKTEIQYLDELTIIARQDAINKLVGFEPDLIILTEEQTSPEELTALCEQNQTPLISSTRSSSKLIRELGYYLSNSLTKVTTIHGVYMEIMTIGVLLVGDSGVGKSELAVELITRGHRLITDDAPEFKRISVDDISGANPDHALTNFLEVRGLGIINIRELFGTDSVKQHQSLHLIIHLKRYDNKEMKHVDRLEACYDSVNILGMDIPEITLPVTPGRNLAVMVECATRNHILRLRGYNSTEDFIQRQQQIMENENQ